MIAITGSTGCHERTQSNLVWLEQFQDVHSSMCQVKLAWVDYKKNMCTRVCTTHVYSTCTGMHIHVSIACTVCSITQMLAHDPW